MKQDTREVSIETFGGKISELRKKRGMTQDLVAKRLGITRAALGHYETNRRVPNFDLLLSFSSIFNVSTDYLLGRKDLIQSSLIPLNSLCIPGTFNAGGSQEVSEVPVVMVPVLNTSSPEWSLEPQYVVGHLPVLSGELDMDTGEYFWMRVADDGMQFDGITRGAFALICTPTAEVVGGISVVTVGTETYLRRVYRRSDETVLQASNPDYPLLFLDHGVFVRGHVIRVLRDIP